MNMSEAALRRGRITQEDRAASFPPYPADWYIEDEEQVPESRPHDLEGEHLRQLFLGWQLRFQLRAAIGRNIAVRPDETHPGVGVDPDVYILENPPAGFDYETSLRLWESGYFPPLLAVEIVSESRPEKDYTQSPLKYAVNGTRELWVFDPKMCRARKHGPPIRLQVWRRDDKGNFDRVYAGEGPVYSEALHAWIFVTNEGQNINIADDAEGTRWWMTPAEQERAAKEAALKQVGHERAARDAALKQADEERQGRDAALKQADEERQARDAALKQADEERQARDAALKQADEERQAREAALKQADEERQARDAALKQADEERQARDAALKQADEERQAREVALKQADEERQAREVALKQADEERQAREAALKQADEERQAREAALKQADEERQARDAALKRVDQEREAREAERLAKEQALARIAELEAMLARRG